MSFNFECFEKLNTMPTIQSISRSPSSISPNTFSSEAGGFAEHMKRSSSEIEEHLQNIDYNSEENQDEKKCWTSNEERLLLELHNEFGNKWTSIAAKIEGRDHNSVKNHFYAEIRKSLRRLNFFIKVYLSDKFKQININHVSKMVTILSEKSDEETVPTKIYSQIESTFCLIAELKKYLFMISKKTEEDSLDEQELFEMNENLLIMKELLEKIKKSNILNRPKRNKKIELNLFDNNIKVQLNSPKQIEAQNISLPLTPQMEMPRQNNQCFYMLYFYPNSWGHVDYTNEQNLMKWMEVFGRS